MSAASDFKGDYSPGGLSGKALARVRREHRRACARRAGFASGRRRRQLAQARRGHAGPGQLTAELSYEHRQVSRREYEHDYLQAFPPPDWPAARVSWERCKEATWEFIMGCYRLRCARGQHCRTTHPQRQAAMRRRGLERTVRSSYNYRKRMETLGYAYVMHVRRPSFKDCLSIEWNLHRRLPTNSFSDPLREQGTSATAESSLPPPKTSLPPPAAADEDIESPSAPVTENSSPGDWAAMKTRWRQSLPLSPEFRARRELESRLRPRLDSGARCNAPSPKGSNGPAGAG